MTGVRRVIAAASLSLLFAVGDGASLVEGHNLVPEHTAGAICIADQFGNVGLQSWVGNMVAFPVAGNGFVVTGNGMTAGGWSTIVNGQWLFYQVRAYWQDNAGSWFYRSGNWLARQGQMGGAVDPWTTLVETPTSSTGWANATVNLLYNGADNARPDASLVRLPGHGTYTLWAHFYWGVVTDGAGRVLMNPTDHWQSMGRVSC